MKLIGRMMPSSPQLPPQMRNPKAPAERIRLFRRRRKFRRQLVTVEVDPREVDALIERGYLEPQDRDDREALAAAVTACFSDALSSSISKRRMRLLPEISESSATRQTDTLSASQQVVRMAPLIIGRCTASAIVSH